MDIIKTVFLFSSILLLCFPTAHSSYYSKSKPYTPAQLKKTNLHFYLHDTLSGADPTAVRIAGPNATEYNPLPFGSLFAFHDPLTEGPELTSNSIGSGNGLYLSASQGEVPALVLYADISFTYGKFKGSSLSVLSRNAVTESLRELAVVGGTGKFTMATGTIFVTTHYVDVTTGDAILEYNVEVVHPDQGRVVQEL